MKDRGIIVGKNGLERNVLAFQPPLVITEEDIKEVLVNNEKILISLENIRIFFENKSIKYGIRINGNCGKF